MKVQPPSWKLFKLHRSLLFIKEMRRKIFLKNSPFFAFFSTSPPPPSPPNLVYEFFHQLEKKISLVMWARRKNYYLCMCLRGFLWKEKSLSERKEGRGLCNRFSSGTNNISLTGSGFRIWNKNLQNYEIFFLPSSDRTCVVKRSRLRFDFSMFLFFLPFTVYEEKLNVHLWARNMILCHEIWRLRAFTMLLASNFPAARHRRVLMKSCL